MPNSKHPNSNLGTQMPQSPEVPFTADRCSGTCVESNISKSPDLTSSTQTSKHFNLKLAKKSIYHKNTNTNTLELGPSKNSETSHPEHRPINNSNPGFQIIKKFIDLKFMPCSIKTVPHHI